MAPDSARFFGGGAKSGKEVYFGNGNASFVHHAISVLIKIVLRILAV